MTQSDLSEAALIRRYEAAAGKAAVVELKLRILAEVVPELEHLAHAFRIDEDDIFAWFDAAGEPVPSADKTAVEITRTLRNKLLHGDLRKAREQMHDLGAPKKTGGLKHMRFDDAAGSMLAQIDAALRDDTMTPVANMKTADAGIGGWLTEMSLAGDFGRASDLCARASDLIEDLIAKANDIVGRRARAL